MESSYKSSVVYAVLQREFVVVWNSHKGSRIRDDSNGSQAEADLPDDKLE